MPRKMFSEILKTGTPVLGTWSQFASEECVDVLGAAGFDFTVVDCEHGAFGLETAEKLIRACDANGLASVVRAPSLDRSFIGRALDAGASAVVVPGIASASDASAAVAATRYGPGGTRGACPCIRAAGHMATDWPAYTRQQHQGTGIIALVETPEGVADIENIVRVDGLLTLMVGPFDLSVAMGHAGHYRHPDVLAAVERMVRASRDAGLPVMVPLFDPDPAEARRQQIEWSSRGVHIFLVGTDKIMFADAARRYARALGVAP